MLLEPKDTLTTAYSNLKHELLRATNDRKHPFRFCVLGTYGKSLSMRYVVLREIDKEFCFYVYTDNRSKKVEDIRENAEVQILFYHPKKRAQVIVSGEASISHLNNTSRHHWEKISKEAMGAYTSTIPPGTIIHSPQDAYQWLGDTDEHFNVIRISPLKIECLQLNGKEHIRASFLKSNGWEGSWIAP